MSPTPTLEAVEPVGSLRDFVIDASTTGKDLMERLSTEETDCVRAAFGEAVYQLILATPLLQGGSAEGTATLFGCMETDSVAMFGVAFDNVLVGGRSEETSACLVDLSLEHPKIVYLQLGLEWKGEQSSPASERHTFILQYWDCLTDAEAIELVYRVNEATDKVSSLTGRDLVDLLPESEATCMRHDLSEEQLNALLAATPLEAVRLGASAAHCLSPESIASLFAASTEAVVGGLTEESDLEWSGSARASGRPGSWRTGGAEERSAAGERTSPPSLPLEGPCGPALGGVTPCLHGRVRQAYRPETGTPRV